MIHNNIKASDTLAFFQAKNMRQTAYEIAIVEIEGDLAEAGLTPERRATMERQLAEHRATIARYESEPDPAAPNDPLRGEGKRQLRAQAQAYEAAREVVGTGTASISRRCCSRSPSCSVRSRSSRSTGRSSSCQAYSGCWGRRSP